MVFIHLLAGTPNAYYLKYQLNVVLVILAMEVRDYCKCGNYVSVEPFEGAFANFRHDYNRYYFTEWVWIFMWSTVQDIWRESFQIQNSLGLLLCILDSRRSKFLLGSFLHSINDCRTLKAIAKAVM